METEKRKKGKVMKNIARLASIQVYVRDFYFQPPKSNKVPEVICIISPVDAFYMYNTVSIKYNTVSIKHNTGESK